jgi:hypothetical protein
MNRLLKYFLPATLVAGFLCSYFLLLAGYTVQFDDCFFDGLTQRFGIWKTYGICHSLVNGRWLGNLLASIIFYVAGHNFTAYAAFLVLFLAGFVWAASMLFRNFLLTFRQQRIGTGAALLLGLSFTALLYFLLYDGRRQVWGWLDAATVHLLSVTLCMALFAALIRTENWNRRFLILLLAFCLGGLNEVNAVCSLMLVAGLYFTRNCYAGIRLSRFSLLLAAIGISVSLAINLSSPGYNMRVNTLPGFSLLQAMKNTLHTMAMPVLEPGLISLGAWLAALLLVTWPFFSGRRRSPLIDKAEKRAIAFSLALVGFSFFLNCYTLSDVVPARSALWGYTLLLFVIVQQALRYLPLTSGK